LGASLFQFRSIWSAHSQGVFTVTNNHSLIVSQLKAGVINVRDGSDTKAQPEYFPCHVLMSWNQSFGIASEVEARFMISINKLM